MSVQNGCESLESAGTPILQERGDILLYYIGCPVSLLLPFYPESPSAQVFFPFDTFTILIIFRDIHPGIIGQLILRTRPVVYPSDIQSSGYAIRITEHVLTQISWFTCLICFLSIFVSVSTNQERSTILFKWILKGDINS